MEDRYEEKNFTEKKNNNYFIGIILFGIRCYDVDIQSCYEDIYYEEYDRTVYT